MQKLIGKIWPLKLFFSYIFKRLLGKFVNNVLDLSKFEFSKSSISLEDIDLNAFVSPRVYFPFIRL